MVDSEKPIEEEHSSSSEEESMTLEPDELDLALELKRAVEERDDLRPLSDFMYAHHAIGAMGCLDTALTRIEGLQHFYEEYGIDESVTQGVEAVQQYLELHPTSILQLNNVHSEEENSRSVAIAWDLGKVVPEKVFKMDKEMQTDRHWKIHARGTFYANLATFPNLESMRNGSVVLIEGSTFGWENFNTKCERRLQEEFFLHYPGYPRKVLLYHTNLVINTLAGVVKSVLPKHIKDTFQLGCTIEGYEEANVTLRDLFLQPSPEVAQVNLLCELQNLLEERIKNEKAFRL